MLVGTKHGMYINGEWISETAGGVIDVYNPATLEKIAEVPNGSVKETERAIQAAKVAFEPWANLTARERSSYLYKAYHKMMERKEELARLLTLEQGKPLREARGEIEFAASFLLWYAEEANRVYGEMIPSSKKGKRLWVVPKPIGVVAAITPWNFPSAMVTRKVAPAIAAGCTVVLKPAEQTPLSAIEIVKIFEEVGLPKGVLNLVTGDPIEIGKVLTESSDVRSITFTGSTEVGKLLMKGSAQNVKKLSLELGGHAPLLVLEDADLDLAAELAVASKYRNCGQTCICTNRIFVQESVKEEFTRKLQEKVKQLQMGNGLDDGVTIGPLIDKGGLEKVKRQVEDAISKGANVIAGGKERKGPGGYYYEPTILINVSNHMDIMYEETFGPVVPIVSFTSIEEAIQAANDTDYGLAAFLFTNDLSKAITIMERLEYGIIGINDVFPGTAEAPFGGVKQSGLGREGGREGIQEFIEMKYVSIAIKDV
ncbi:NAD-dependent succinate-semialdehyde dehydrogenase [Neobacillus thermocopriae]|jgi:succinate-semialdehyde dehydrogenase / glutarate-semialdehyde dehydrogenase|uniref:NAD-dependent succinate-semialdehyde dehydrogenase n=1 Tax=Neobacillus thermocopriae TaxID=1215031 RepID=UPI002E1B4541|nr:NAD-dependent succinate-semialdehyde dehydrogenase [Neobacillus thermocopriae]MED3713408.1 NAD-dependent succinate-semialdehyde dehydrogenase [Neobacillus thermocopriae]